MSSIIYELSNKCLWRRSSSTVSLPALRWLIKHCWDGDVWRVDGSRITKFLNWNWEDKFKQGEQNKCFKDEQNCSFKQCSLDTDFWEAMKNRVILFDPHFRLTKFYIADPWLTVGQVDILDSHGFKHVTENIRRI